MIEWGFTLDDIEKVRRECDYRVYPALIQEIEKLQEIKAIAARLDLAEALNVAFVGSQPGSGNSGQLKSWRSTNIARINKLLKRATKTIWDLIGGKSRKL